MIPPEQDADFVYYGEDVLDLYHGPYDETRPVICFDESSNRLVNWQFTTDDVRIKPRRLSPVELGKD